MKNKNPEEGLITLVEQALYPSLKVLIQSGLSRETLDSEQLKVIIGFINKLPQNYIEMPKRDEIIAKCLQKRGMETKWGKKKLEELRQQQFQNSYTGKMLYTEER